MSIELENVISLFACFFLIMGAIECFSGYKALKVMLVIWGFLIGAMLGVVSGVLLDNTILGVILVLLFSVALAALFYKLYLVGVFLITFFLMIISLYLLTNNWLISMFLSAVTGIVSVFFVKPATIITTAFSGAGVLLASAYLMMGVMQPSDLRIANNIKLITVFLLWLPITLSGIFCQFATTKNTKFGSYKGNRIPAECSLESTFSERKYPGMQRAYRNFCIKCGRQLWGQTVKCPRCGYDYDE